MYNTRRVSKIKNKYIAIGEFKSEAIGAEAFFFFFFLLGAWTELFCFVFPFFN